jgi:methyl-accepting chemotaxis protein
MSESTAPDSGHSGWMKPLTESIADLNELARSTESEFLWIGEQLQDFYGRAKGLSGMAMSVGETMTGSDCLGTVDGLNYLHQSIKSLDIAEQQAAATLESIVAQIVNTYEPRARVKKALKTLNAARVLMQVENARLDHASANLKTTALVVADLITEIQLRFQNLTGLLSAMSEHIAGSLRSLRSGSRRQQDQGQQLLDGILETLTPLTAKLQSSGGLVGALGERYDKVTKHIGNIVTSLQVHDMSRQRIEHVREALEDIVESSDHGEQSLSAPVTENSEGVDFEEISHICRLQIDQLTDTKEDTFKPILSLCDDLKQIAKAVIEITQEARELIGLENATQHTFLRAISSRLEMLQPVFRDYIEMSTRLSTTMSKVTDATSAISQSIGDIDRFSDQMKVIALNARINANHAGTEGACLGVLAQSLQGLADEIGSQIEHISENLRSVIDSAATLCNQTSILTASGDQGVQSLADKCEGMILTLHQVDGETAATFRTINNSADKLYGDIGDTLENINVHRTFERVMDKVIAALSLVNRSLSGYRGTKPKIANRLELRRFEARYTMDHERKTHRSFTAPSAPERRPLQHSPAQTESQDGSAPVELGENVELF